MTGRDAIAPPIPNAGPAFLAKAGKNFLTCPPSSLMIAPKGLFNMLLKPNQNALEAKSAVNPNTFFNPRVAAVKVAPITSKPVTNLPFNLFSKSIFPSEFA